MTFCFLNMVSRHVDHRKGDMDILEVVSPLKSMFFVTIEKNGKLLSRQTATFAFSTHDSNKLKMIKVKLLCISVIGGA
jgi:hypothetical protein